MEISVQELTVLTDRIKELEAEHADYLECIQARTDWISKYNNERQRRQELEEKLRTESLRGTQTFDGRTGGMPSLVGEHA